ncbi:MAG: response regulator [bacterium]|jgi:two-component system cell cycle sensor histidine kinase/response regulator CckA|nr:response regulator [bacterium]
MSSRATILVVDDEFGPREAFRMLFKDCYRVITVGSGKEAMAIIDSEGDKIDLILLDIRMPEDDGITVLQEIKSRNPEIEVAMVTAYASVETARDALKYGAIDYLIKPFDRIDAEEIVKRGIMRRREQRESKVALQRLQLVNNALLGNAEQACYEDIRADAVITADTTGRIIMMNKVAEELSGWSLEDAVGREIDEVFNIVSGKTGRRCRGIFEKILRAGCIVGLTSLTVLISKDGSRRTIADSGTTVCGKDGAIIGVVIVFRDITEKIIMEDELIKARKLESLGILAGGIAHDFNNILMAVLGNISLTRREVTADTGLYAKLFEAEKAVIRAKELTQQLLTFAKGGTPIKSMASIKELITDSADFALRGSNVSCNYDVAEDLWPIEADEGQISQVISNLVINADQAMPEGGVIRITATNISIDPSRIDGVVVEGKYIKISISDSGVGMPREHLQRIFDPYFTTRKSGSGLGLAIVYSIVKKHGGLITVESEHGKGTAFHIYLPASQKEIKTVDKPAKIMALDTGKVLVMDDEEAVRSVVGRILEHLGWEVECAEEGSQAIEAYKAALNSGYPFDVVIMDLTIPGGMGGKDAAEQLRALDAKAKVIVSSGYSNDPVLAEYRQYGFSGVINKPYRIEEMIDILYRVTHSDSAETESTGFPNK